MHRISDKDWYFLQNEKGVRKWIVTCEGCGAEAKIITTAIVQMLHDGQIVTARVCHHCSTKALLIPGIDPARPWLQN